MKCKAVAHYVIENNIRRMGASSLCLRQCPLRSHCRDYATRQEAIWLSLWP